MQIQCFGVLDRSDVGHFGLGGSTDELMDQLARLIVDAALAKDKNHRLYRLNRFRDYLIEDAFAPARSMPLRKISPKVALK